MLLGKEQYTLTAVKTTLLGVQQPFTPFTPYVTLLAANHGLATPGAGYTPQYQCELKMLEQHAARQQTQWRHMSAYRLVAAAELPRSGTLCCQVG